MFPVGAFFQCLCKLHSGFLRQAVGQDVSFRIEQDGAADDIIPVIVVSYAAQARFNPSEDDGLVFLKYCLIRLV